ncbi:MAG: hypothetical protein AAF334_00380, partial [Pseudomonadota bacterium]
MFYHRLATNWKNDGPAEIVGWSGRTVGRAVMVLVHDWAIGMSCRFPVAWRRRRTFVYDRRHDVE